jgi:hypothetical protein
MEPSPFWKQKWCRRKRFLCQLVQCVIYIDGIINRRDVAPVVLDKSLHDGGLGIVADVNNLALGEDGSFAIGRGGLFPGEAGC